MKKFFRFSSACLLLTGMVLVFLSSCVTPKQIKYLQKKQKEDTTSFYKNRRTLDYKIQQHDHLYIRILTMDEKSSSYFNQMTQAGGSSGSSSSNLYLDSYLVNDSGYIDFPMIGNIYVKDLRVDQAKLLIQSLVREYLKDVQVQLRMVNFKVTLLGEVRSPGEKEVMQEKINIFEAISQAGDLTSFANRAQVALIRQTKDGSRVIYLDLNNIDILKSPYYYLEPNDILYFKPLGIKTWGFGETFPWAFVFSMISFALVLITYFKAF
ncbi:MAG: polysaccharide biosynthesis/export family protein [Bacteroidetes bacterium]|nr:polysaccharide biosynthesis/export family protein [Bacteroidota bacterium]